MKNKIYGTLFLIGAIILIAFLVHDCGGKGEPENYVAPPPAKKDTIHPKEFKPEVLVPNVMPSKVKQYKKPNIEKRKIIEKQPIIEQVISTPKGLEVTKMDTLGIETTDVYKFEEPPAAVVIDNNGKVEEKKRTWAGRNIRKVGKFIVIGLAVVGTVAILAVAGGG